ncbi:C2 domain-containing protein [Streptomyces sp. C]|uniref:C2 domain-containing protein n=1 Tax=Streptomyces sp. C TaxID=253839 RepID=UPI0001B581A9|nr:C2 domain-containing protein [Streptomyces sp. C]
MANLKITLCEGRVAAADLFNSDPYVAVTVAETRVQSPIEEDTTSLQWNWEYVFENITPDHRVRFHVYDSDTPDPDDDLGYFQTTVARFLNGKEGAKQTIHVGDSTLVVVGTWV